MGPGRKSWVHGAPLARGSLQTVVRKSWVRLGARRATLDDLSSESHYFRRAQHPHRAAFARQGSSKVAPRAQRRTQPSGTKADPTFPDGRGTPLAREAPWTQLFRPGPSLSQGLSRWLAIEHRREALILMDFGVFLPSYRCSSPAHSPVQPEQGSGRGTAQARKKHHDAKQRVASVWLGPEI